MPGGRCSGSSPAIAASALVLSRLTFEDAPPADPDSPRDLRRSRWPPSAASPRSSAPRSCSPTPFLDAARPSCRCSAGWRDRRADRLPVPGQRPLLTIRTMLSSTIPVAGIVVALFAAAASVSATALTASVLATRYGPLHVGLLYLPEFAGAVMTAVAARLADHPTRAPLPPAGRHGVPRSRHRRLPDRLPPSEAPTLIGSGLTGIGLGATVAPALFVAGFSLPSANLQRVFAIVELMRAVAAFMIAPIFAHLAATVGGNLDAGPASLCGSASGLALGGAAIGVGIYALGGARPQTPDIDRFVAGEAPAWYSPPLLARLRPGLTGVQPATGAPTEVAASDPSAVAAPRRRAGALRLRRLRAGQARDRARPAASLPRTRGAHRSASGSRATSGSYRAASSASTPPKPPRCAGPRRRPPLTEHPWRRRLGFARRASRSRQRRPGRASSSLPRSGEQASSCSAPTAAAGSRDTCSAASRPP